MVGRHQVGIGAQQHRRTVPEAPRRSNPTGQIGGWKIILNALTIHYGDRIIETVAQL